MSDDMPTGEKLAKSAQPAVTALPEAEITRLNDEIVTALKTVYDPEIPADIYEIGLIYLGHCICCASIGTAAGCI